MRLCVCLRQTKLWRTGCRPADVTVHHCTIHPKDARRLYVRQQLAGKRCQLRAVYTCRYIFAVARNRGFAYRVQHLFYAEPSAEQLHDFQLQCMATVLPYLTNYIWQQDPFTLHSSTKSKPPWSRANARRQHNQHSDQSVPENLWGVTRFGDNIEDEWFILWLLQQITTKVSTPA